MGWKTGFEPATPGITIRCSNQLSYIHHRSHSKTPRVASWLPLPDRPIERYCNSFGAPGRNRTCNRRLRRPVLYPVELRARGRMIAVRTERYMFVDSLLVKSLLVINLPVINLPMKNLGLVGVEGFEPPTSCSQSRRATRLRYTPRLKRYDPGGCPPARHPASSQFAIVLIEARPVNEIPPIPTRRPVRESSQRRLHRESMQEPGMLNLLYDHTMRRSICVAAIQC
jgi:hypothetical protein